MRAMIAVGVVLAAVVAPAARGQDEAIPLAPGVRGLVTFASGGVVLDGKLTEWGNAFCTPVHYNHPRLLDRAAQFYYQWDRAGLYIGLRALDKHRANPGPAGQVYNGDAVEFYLDTRQGEALRGQEWSAGAVHLFFSAFTGDAVRPRWEMRRGIATSDTILRGARIAATATEEGYEVEFLIPWANFPAFKPQVGSVLALDAELCSGDGEARTDRTFAYGSPLSVQQPASLGKVQLVRSFEPEYLPAVGVAAFPMWAETPWVQSDRAQAQAVVAIPPAFTEFAGAVEVRLHDADGKVLQVVPAQVETFGPAGWNFARAVARWSIDEPTPGTYFASARVLARTGKPMVKVVPRMVQEAQMSGR